MKPIWIVSIALALSLLGHLILFFGIPFLSFNSAPEVSEDLIIKTELRPEPPKKIQMAKAPTKKVLSSNQSQSPIGDPTGSESGTGQGGATDQKGAAFRLPESGIIYYDTFVDGQQYQTGEIDWITDGTNYRLYINIPYAFVGPFVFESRGTVDAYGLAPSIYWTQRGTRNPRYSRFDRNEKGGGQMYFSEKPEFTPEIIPGTQDRFSLMFQVASLLNGDDKIDEVGTIRAIPVVDYNTLEMWQFKSYGEAVTEDIPSLGKTTTRHYALMQREKDPYKRQVDIWLAKDLDWLPGRIRSQESNGRVLELIFKQKAPIK
ncbi:DUF3108 domain-containing protein [Polynucleobacter sp. 15G-AUS-farblos]|uniref:DUF3108 domain-containing protein n=1 Tax=Polynucleobacter sp. 15G-AUS-farblos TaxID=2689094 RepID=UPI001C0C4478|nr:DUF3108 domain-containing protein [Polynucleobacter sp. 15G-AUS-farblos]MBU3584500.1 DUF3108 domain-containing protein [Polynucleobacter sp. 15G-AUS-farblos]